MKEWFITDENDEDDENGSGHAQICADSPADCLHEPCVKAQTQEAQSSKLIQTSHRAHRLVIINCNVVIEAKRLERHSDATKWHHCHHTTLE